MDYQIGERVVVKMRDLNPDVIPTSPWSEMTGTVVENPTPGIYHVQLDGSVGGLDILEDVSEDWIGPYAPIDA